MSRATLGLETSLHDYLLRVGVREHPLLAELRQLTLSRPDNQMQISPEQGQFMQFLVAALGVRRALEIGVFTGYSSLSTVLALPEDGRLIGLDINPETTSIAQRFVERAGLAQRFELRLGPALESLERLKSEATGCFDFIFIDADKTNYLGYYEAALQLLSPRGVIAVDNVLWGGSVVDTSNQAEDTCAVRAFNEALAEDPRVEITLLPIGDGLTLARKRTDPVRPATGSA